ncbi:regulator of G-protein signaling 22 [Stegostoma tigrinum]|uniref:regulator of G-protein signaling 22 n=1 Tax=Stegostoma tigrinum TaxID=3053191 RepID=UPI002870760B|nr:regulator of G-protein signaling 22 [Stegostoma tigrinum]
MEQRNTSPDKFTTEPPDVTVNEFEDYLLTDSLLVDYFNMFLSLLNFPMPIWFNKRTETFEIVDNAKKNLLRRLKRLVHTYSPADPIYNATLRSQERHPRFKKITALDLKFENKFIVRHLDHVQGIAWIKNERLPTFLLSDCYFEYRLAKLLSQLESNTGPGVPQIDPTYRPWVTEKEEGKEAHLTKILDMVDNTLEETEEEEEETEEEEEETEEEEESEEEIKEEHFMSKTVDIVEDATGQVYISYENGNDLVSVKSEASLLMTSLYLPMLLSHASVAQTKTLSTGTVEEAPMVNFKSELETVVSFKASSHTSTTSVKTMDNVATVIEEILSNISAAKLLRHSRQVSDSTQYSCIPSLSKPVIVDDELFEFVPAYHFDGQEIIYLQPKPENETKHGQKVNKKNKEVSTDDKAVMNEDKANEKAKLHVQKVHIGTKTRAHKDLVSTSDKAATHGTETNLPSETEEMKFHLESNIYPAPDSNISQTAQLDVQQSSVVSDNIRTQSFSNAVGEDSMESDSTNEEGDIRDFCYMEPPHSFNFKNRKGIEKFKKFLQGTAGEKYWWLWMDIERLKVIEDGKKKQSCLNKIRNRYLFNGGEYCMNVETRAKLGLSFVSQWTVENLSQVQSDVVSPLLLYWGPRYCINKGFPIRQAGIALKDWEDRHLRPKSDVGPFPLTLPNPAKVECIPDKKQPKKNCKSRQHQRKVPQNRLSSNKHCTRTMSDTGLCKPASKKELPLSSDTVQSQVSKEKFMENLENLELRKAKDLRNLEMLMQIKKYHDVLCDAKLDDLLQALHNESRTGYYFTRFCEKAGNTLWRNGVSLWFDLKEYQRLFYAEIFQPFKLKRQAQFIFATYVIEGAPADVQMDAENKKEIYAKLEPPFEDLFDQLEEHTLILLLVPWNQMIEAEMSSYNKVKLVTKTQYLDSIYYKKLQELQRKFLPHEFPSKASIQEEIVEDPRSAWKFVPEQFRHYTFQTLLHNRLELDQFQTFLKENLADMDLNCWMDIEFYTNISRHEKESKNIKSKEIINKYMNRKYFFGPSSPATKPQQEEVLALAGGQENLLHNLLSSEAALEVQRYAKDRMERQWLPMFLSTPEFAESQQIRIKLQEVIEDQMLHKSRKKRDVMKHMENKWTASSKEIIAFRKALLNPVTALQFRKFVSTKGELMENNVLFWLEVQKYKDLCHSHATVETIQNKITVIINCFINSNIPPALQIDIPAEYANRIINQRDQQGPYIFREAQMAVFDILFKQWPQFSDFRRSIAIESIEAKKGQEVMQSGNTEKNLIQLTSIHNRKSGLLQSPSLDPESGSSGSQLSLKGGSDKPTQSQPEMKPGSAGTNQGSRHSQKLSWSFSKYLEALNREESLILKAREADGKESSRTEASKIEADGVDSRRVQSAAINILPPGNWLADRKQRVKSFSEMAALVKGLQQVSVLGPQLFTTYINVLDE